MHASHHLVPINRGYMHVLAVYLCCSKTSFMHSFNLIMILHHEIIKGIFSCDSQFILSAYTISACSCSVMVTWENIIIVIHIGMRLLCYSAMLTFFTYYAFKYAADSQLITSSTVVSWLSCMLLSQDDNTFLYISWNYNFMKYHY